MRSLVYAIAWVLGAAALGAAPVAAAWDAGGTLVQVQDQKGRRGQGPERGERGRDARQERSDDRDRRERMSDDDRRSLHRDLDKANRELYGRRQK